MKFLIDLQHPAHLHFFRNLILRLIGEGHEVVVTGRDKDILRELSRTVGFQVAFFGVARKGVFSLATEFIYRQWHLFKIVRNFEPDVMMAIAGTYISIVGKLMRIPTYVFYDTEHATLSNLLSYPFARCIYVPKCYKNEIRWNHIRYNGYHELAYLHPKYFTPDKSVLEKIGLNAGEVFSIARFVGWGAAHDIGLTGFTHANKLRAIDELSRYGRVLISCEGDLPDELEEYRLHLDVSRIHSLMAFSSLIFGESATMCSEGAVLGVPGIYVDPIGRGYTDEQERDYGLVFNFTNEQQDEAISKGVEILSSFQREEWQARGKRLVEEKIDVGEMLYRVAMERPFA